MDKEVEALKRALERERQARKFSERILEEKSSELFVLNQNLQRANDLLETKVKERTNEIERIARFPGENPAPIIRMNKMGGLEYFNKSARDLLDEGGKELYTLIDRWISEVGTNEDTFLRDFQTDFSFYNVTVVPILNEGYINFYFSDVTNERISTSRLEQSEKRYRKIVEESLDFIIKMDLDGDIIYLNPAAIAFLGYSSEQLMGSNYCELVTSEYQSMMKEHLQMLKLLGDKIVSTFEFTINTKSNGIRWITQNMQFSVDGAMSSLTIIARDVTERKLVEEKLIRSEEKYKSVIENMQLGLLEVDTDNKITRVYDHFCKLTGYSEKELIGKRAVDVLLSDKDEKHEVEKQQVLRNFGVESVYETPIIKKNGERAFVLISGAPLYNDFGVVTGAIGIHLDITSRKHIENELIKARQKAEESSRSKELFLANMSHEIRTPMNAILGMTDLLQKTALNENQEKLLNAVSISATNLLVIINDVLDLSKVESGKLTFEKIGFKLLPIVEHIIDTSRVRAAAKDILIDYKIADEIPDIYLGDPFRLNQILLNLVGNAIKFTDKGKVQLNISSKKQSAKNARLFFSVLDTGKGISKEKMEHVFESFKQEDSSISRNFGGTGLGLSISKKLVEMQGGGVSVESEVGKGSCFAFYIDYEIGSEIDIPDTENNEADLTRLNRLKILLAEDNRFNQTLVQNLFLEYNIDLTIAENGEEVIMNLPLKAYDIILMDIQMPVMDGIEATKFIRRSKRFKDIPILALTANAFHDELQKYIEYGMDDYLSKPFKSSALFSKILQLVFKDEIVPVIKESPVIDVPFVVEENTPLYSLKKLEEMAKGNEVFVEKMVTSFIEYTPTVIHELRERASQNDWVKVAALCHRLKASVNTLSMNSIIDDLVVLEKKYEQLSITERLDRLNSVIEIVTKVVDDLKK